MKHDRLLSLLEQANSILLTLATTNTLPNGQKLDDLSDDDFVTVFMTVDKFNNSVQSARKHLALLRALSEELRS